MCLCALALFLRDKGQSCRHTTALHCHAAAQYAFDASKAAAVAQPSPIKHRPQMKAISSRTLAISCLQACAIGFGAGYIARGWPASTVPKGAFFLLVQMEFKSVADREKAEAIFAPEARWCRDHEPGTLSYEWARSDSNDRAIIVVERYADKETAYASVHKSSEAFKKFRPQLAALEPVINGHSYVASDIGYTSRFE